MKRLLLLPFFISIFLFSACYHEKCVRCDIYDEYGDYVKDYGKFCGDYNQVEDYEADADYHAWYYYGGWADCYRSRF